MSRLVRGDAGRVGTDWLESFLAAVDAIPTWQLYAIVGLLLVLETTVLIGLVVPGDIAVLAAAATVSDAWEFAALAAVATGATMVGQLGGYGLGRRYGYPIRESWAGRRIKTAHWKRAEAALQSGTGRALIGSRFVAVVHSLVPVLAGALRMPFARFVRYTAIGAVVWALVYVALGSAASAVLREAAHLVGPVFTGICVLAVVALVVAHRLRVRRAEATKGIHIAG